MIKTVGGGCTDAGVPFDYAGPEYGSPGPNTCVSVQFAAHTPSS